MIVVMEKKSSDPCSMLGRAKTVNLDLQLGLIEYQYICSRININTNSSTTKLVEQVFWCKCSYC